MREYLLGFYAIMLVPGGLQRDNPVLSRSVTNKSYLIETTRLPLIAPFYRRIIKYEARARFWKLVNVVAIRYRLQVLLF